jgi:hypothetical protein
MVSKITEAKFIVIVVIDALHRWASVRIQLFHLLILYFATTWRMVGTNEPITDIVIIVVSE